MVTGLGAGAAAASGVLVGGEMGGGLRVMNSDAHGEPRSMVLLVEAPDGAGSLIGV